MFGYVLAFLTIAMSFEIASAKPQEYYDALEFAQAAQENYISGDFKQMHTMLLDAFRKYPHDPIVAKNLAEFAKIYYMTNPILAPIAASNEFTPSFIRDLTDDNKLTFSFNVTSRANPEDEVDFAYVILPNGKKLEVVGPTTEVSRYMSSSVAGKIVVRGDTAQIPSPLPIGVYTYILQLKGNRNFEYPHILWPDNSTKTFGSVEVDRKSQKIKWTTRTSDAGNNLDGFHSVTLFIYGDTSYRPIWTKELPSSYHQALSGTLDVPQIADGTRLLLDSYEVFSRGYPSISYQNSLKKNY